MLRDDISGNRCRWLSRPTSFNEKGVRNKTAAVSSDELRRLVQLEEQSLPRLLEYIQNLPTELPQYVQDVFSPDDVQKESIQVASAREGGKERVSVPLGPGSSNEIVYNSSTPQPLKRRRMRFKQPPPTAPVKEALLLAATVAVAAGLQSTAIAENKSGDSSAEHKRRRVNDNSLLCTSKHHVCPCDRMAKGNCHACGQACHQNPLDSRCKFFAMEVPPCTRGLHFCAWSDDCRRAGCEACGRMCHKYHTDSSCAFSNSCQVCAAESLYVPHNSELCREAQMNMGCHACNPEGCYSSSDSCFARCTPWPRVTHVCPSSDLAVAAVKIADTSATNPVLIHSAHSTTGPRASLHGRRASRSCWIHNLGQKVEYVI